MGRLIIIATLALPAALAAAVPDWVPEPRRAAFAEYVRTAEASRASADEYAAVLRSPRVIEQCNIDGKRIIYHTRRGTLVERFVITYKDRPAGCEVKDGKAQVDFEEDSIFRRLWDAKEEYGLVAVVFFVLGALAL